MFNDNEKFNLEYVIGLTHKQKTALPLLVKGGSNRKVGSLVGVNKNTISNWRKDPRFWNAEIKLGNQVYEETVRNIMYLSNKSVEILNELLDSEDPQFQFQVAKFVLNKNCKP